jgi:hypothetical protein
MDGAAVKEIAALQDSIQKITMVDGKPYSDYSLKRVFNDPRPCALKFLSLTGLVEYVRQDVEGIKGRKLFLVVDDINHVTLTEAFEGESRARTEFATVTPVKLDAFPFEKFLDVETMIIKLKALFLPSPGLAEIIATLSTVSKDTNVTQADDGVSQTVAARIGIKGSLTEPRENKGIYDLQARRIFPEVTQPTSSFIFRMRPSEPAVTAAIFEADGGAWRIDAIRNIREWLESQKLDIPVLG